MLPIFGQAPRSIAEANGLAFIYDLIAAVISLSALLAICIGAWRPIINHKRCYAIISIYLLFYSFALLNFSGWPTGIQLRLLVPIMPLLYILVILGIQRDKSRPGTSYLRAISRTTIARPLILVCSVAHNTYRIISPAKDARALKGREFVGYSFGAAWITSHTSVDACVMNDYPLERHIQHQHPSTRFDHQSFEKLLEQIHRYDVQYILIAPNDPNQPDQISGADAIVHKWARAHPELFYTAYTDTTHPVHIYKVNRFQ